MTTGYAIQQQNEDQNTLLASQFRLLYNPAHAFADAINMALMFPALRGFWPSSIVGPSGQMNDLSGNGLHLSNTNNALFNSENLAPYTEYDGSTDYHSHVDQADFDIIGNEAYINDNGLTIGGWFYFDNNASSAEMMTAKGNASSAITAYEIRRTGAGLARFGVGNGASIITVSSTDTVLGSQWYYVVGRFTPSTELALFVNNTKDTNVVSVPATLLNTADPFSLAVRASVPNLYMDGRTSLQFLCASSLSDSFINIFFEMTAPLFGINV